VDQAPVPQEPAVRRRAVQDELRTAQDACQRLRAELLALGEGALLPGVHLVAGVGGHPVLLPGIRIAEIAVVVECQPIPAAPPWVAGSFVWRGRPALAIDLASRLGGIPTDSLEAILVILDGEPSVALVVEEIRGIVEDPPVAVGRADAALGPFAGACTVDGNPIPLLAPEVLERAVGRIS
jgi:purine-binding chemotaxis protein CheW